MAESVVLDGTHGNGWQRQWEQSNAGFIASCGGNLSQVMEKQILDARAQGIVQLIWHGNTTIFYNGTDVVKRLNKQHGQFVTMERWIESKLSVVIAPPPRTPEQKVQDKADMMAFFAQQ